MAAKTKKTAKKTSTSKAPTYLTKAKDRETMIIVSALPENPRRKGSKSAKHYDAMAKFIKGKRGVSIATLLTETPYRIEDFHSDLAREYIKVKKGGASA